METILEIIKFTVPALVVFLTVYFMLRYHYNHAYSLELAKLRSESSRTTLNLRLQAYERLALFCERISPDNLILRLREKDMSSQELQNIMILAIKQEYDHNLTQQIYISDKLWMIVEMCKNQVIQLISMSGQASSGVDNFTETLMKAIDEKNPVQTALKAIRKEVELYFS